MITNTIKSKFSASVGAAIAAKENASSASYEDPKVEANVRRVEDVLTRLKGVSGVKTNAVSRDHGKLANTHLTIKGQAYNIISHADDTFRVIPQSTGGSNELSSKLRDVETFDDVVGGIAMIAGYHYPQQASVFDRVLAPQDRTDAPSYRWDINLESC